MVEHSAVNRRVVGSSPTRGADTDCRSNAAVFLYPDFIPFYGNGHPDFIPFFEKSYPDFIPLR